MSDTAEQPPTEALAVTFEEAPAEALPVVLSEKLQIKQRRAAKVAEAKAYEQLGQRILRFKAKKFGEVGQYIVDTIGVKQIGHGTIISATENADQYIRRCGAIIEELMARDPPCDPEAIVAITQLIRDFNRQVLDAGEAHLRIDRQPTADPKADMLQVPFPAGQPMVIAIGQQKPPPPPSVESPALEP